MTDSSKAQPTSQGQGLGASLQGLLATLLAIVHTRLELLATEVEEEKRRMLATLAWGAVAVLLACFALAFAAVFITVVLWESHRLWVLGVMTLSFSAISFWAMQKVKALTSGTDLMLSATLAELDTDRQALMPSEARGSYAPDTKGQL